MAHFYQRTLRCLIHRSSNRLNQTFFQVISKSILFPKPLKLIISRNYLLLFNLMKQLKDKKIDKPLRLPQISTKTSSSFSTQTTPNSRVRPSSSSKLNDLQKNLFNQLDQYEDLDKKLGKKSKTRKQIQAVGSKQLCSDWIDTEAPYLKKLEKLLPPETYSKLLQAKRPQPLQQTNKVIKPKKTISQEHTQSKIASSANLKQSKEAKQKKIPNNKQQKRQNSFTVAQREVEQIFQQYLQQQGMTDLTEIKSQDLKQLNAQINSTQADINEVRKSMYDLIRRFGDQCAFFEQREAKQG